jgi:type II secretion system protein G
MSHILADRRGFTIVELLIVIVVLGILVGLPVAAYSGVQQRGRDTVRVNDMRAIIKALEMYKVQTGSYPTANTVNTISDWEVSSVNPSQFLSVLKTSGTVSKVPVDPTNNGTTTNGLLYRYYRYNAGTNGCDASKGAYYVLVAGKAESTSGQISGSPGFQCASRNWSADGGWVAGAFTNS